MRSGDRPSPESEAKPVPSSDQDAPRKAGKPPKEGRFARHRRLAGELSREPKQAIPLMRRTVFETWRSRGGGFYGLGYLITFTYLQVGVFIGDVAESDSVGGFALATLFEYLIRVSFMAFLNVFLALLWPFYVLEHFQGMGIILLVAGYLSFEFALRPVIERRFPELRDPASANPDQ